MATFSYGVLVVHMHLPSQSAVGHEHSIPMVNCIQKSQLACAAQSWRGGAVQSFGSSLLALWLWFRRWLHDDIVGFVPVVACQLHNVNG